jgi:hypothetical protein
MQLRRAEWVKKQLIIGTFLRVVSHASGNDHDMILSKHVRILLYMLTDNKKKK